MTCLQLLYNNALFICCLAWEECASLFAGPLLVWPHANEPAHDKTNKMTCAPSEDSDQPGHPSSLIRVFAVRSIGSLGPNVSSCGQRRL